MLSNGAFSIHVVMCVKLKVIKVMWSESLGTEGLVISMMYCEQCIHLRAQLGEKHYQAVTHMVLTNAGW